MNLFLMLVFLFGHVQPIASCRFGIILQHRSLVNVPCCRYINRLTPEASLYHGEEQEVAKVLKNIARYNLLFVGGARGLLQVIVSWQRMFKC